jgi:hypothetical protein
VDFDSGKSRIDFYGGVIFFFFAFLFTYLLFMSLACFSKTGMEKTYQLANEGPHGTAKKIAPMTTETVKNQLNCFQTSGSADEPVTVQGVLPDISSFKVQQ